MLPPSRRRLLLGVLFGIGCWSGNSASAQTFAPPLPSAPAPSAERLRDDAEFRKGSPFEVGTEAPPQARKLRDEDAIPVASRVRVPEYSDLLGERTTSVSVDWITPESILVGDEGSYDLVVLNRGRLAIEDVKVVNALPEGFELVEAAPAADEKRDGKPVWSIARIGAEQEVRIRLRMIAKKPGAMKSRARVEFTTSSTAAFRVVEPKLALSAEAPRQVLVGDKAIFHLTVRNDGTGKTTNARVRVLLPVDLFGKDAERKYEVGDLNPGESRSVQVAATTLLRGLGDVKFEATADRNLSDEAEKSLRVIGAELLVEVDGPSFRYVTRPAKYTIRVKNGGSAKAEKVLLRTAVPEAFAFVSGGEDGRFDSRMKHIHWTIGDIPAGEEFVGQFTLRAEQRGEFPILAEAVGSRGLRALDRHRTKVDGIDAILLEVVDVHDPIEVGAETMYEVLVTNQGMEFAENVKVAVKLPEGMKLVGQKGPTQGVLKGETLYFAAVPKLAPRADAIYRVTVEGTRAGDQRVQVHATADSLDSPVGEVESTKVYRDE